MAHPDLLTEKWMTDVAIMRSVESSSIVDRLAVSLMLWHMNQSMQDYLIYQKTQLIKQLLLSGKFMICFPNSLPDNEDDDIPWHDESPEEYD